MVIDAFFELVQHGQSVGGGELDLRFFDRIDGTLGGQRVNGHRSILFECLGRADSADRGALFASLGDPDRAYRASVPRIIVEAR
jgi:hypothetical protein